MGSIYYWPALFEIGGSVSNFLEDAIMNEAELYFSILESYQVWLGIVVICYKQIQWKKMVRELFWLVMDKTRRFQELTALAFACSFACVNFGLL